MNMSLLKIGLVSLSFLSVSAFSIKLFEIHLHLGASASTQVASPLFKVEPNAKFSDHWDISVPNDGQWHDTDLWFLQIKNSYHLVQLPPEIT